MEKPLPYVNFVLLSKYAGQSVRLICKTVQSSDNDLLQVETADLGSVIVRLNNITVPPGTYLCITGNVRKDLSLDAMVIDSFGDDFDLKNMNQLIGLMQKNPSLFL